MDKPATDAYLNKLAIELKLRGLSPRTIESYSFFLEKYLGGLAKPAEQANEQDIKNFLASLVDSYSNKSRSLATSAIRFFYKEILDQPAAVIKIRNPKKSEHIPVVLTKQEIQQLISSADTNKSLLIISFLYSTGIRVSELVNLRVNDMDLQANKGVVRGKGDKQRQIFLSPNLSEKLREYLSKRKDSNPHLFPGREKLPLSPRNIQKLLQYTARKASIQKKVTPHTLRHSFATHHLEAGTDIRLIQALLGHARIDTTQIYTSVSNKNLESLKNPLEDIEA